MSLSNYIIAKCVIALSYPISKIPLKKLRWIGSKLGRILYYCIPKYRKKAIDNVKNCPMLDLKEAQIPEFVKKVFENLGIVMLEYFMMAHMKDPSTLVKVDGQENVYDFLSSYRSFSSLSKKMKSFWTDRGIDFKPLWNYLKTKIDSLNSDYFIKTRWFRIKSPEGIIFWNGHQANWEIAFLDGCRYFKGFAIARPQSNTYLYQWILKSRQRFGGVIIPPKNASLKSVKALLNGQCVGIVGDQADIKHGIFCSFLGRAAYTSPLAALLSYKTGAPIILVTTTRTEKGYLVKCHKTLFANRNLPQEVSIQEVTEKLLHHFEKSILKDPTSWLWIHNRWKLPRAPQGNK